MKNFFYFLLAILLPLLVSCSSSDSPSDEEDDIVTVGISWRSDIESEFYVNVVSALKEAGAKPVLLAQVCNNSIPYVDGKVSKECIDENDYLNLPAADTLKKYPCTYSNAKDVLNGIDAVVFTGGEDISPTLFKQPQPWHGIEDEKDYNATRDVNDYTLMSYCINNDVNVMAICRGMQMLGVVSGATVIQDIPTYFKDKGMDYNYIHRNKKVGNEYRDYSPHDVVVEKGSMLYTLSGNKELLHNVPSWHHQAIESVDGTPLLVAGYTVVNGEKMIEAIERKDCSMAVGLQFHAEAALVKWQVGAANASHFMTKDEALRIFKAFVNKVRARKGKL